MIRNYKRESDKSIPRDFWTNSSYYDPIIPNSKLHLTSKIPVDEINVEDSAVAAADLPIQTIGKNYDGKKR